MGNIVRLGVLTIGELLENVGKQIKQHANDPTNAVDQLASPTQTHRTVIMNTNFCYEPFNPKSFDEDAIRSRSLRSFAGGETISPSIQIEEVLGSGVGGYVGSIKSDQEWLDLVSVSLDFPCFVLVKSDGVDVADTKTINFFRTAYRLGLNAVFAEIHEAAFPLALQNRKNSSMVVYLRRGKMTGKLSLGKKNKEVELKYFIGRRVRKAMTKKTGERIEEKLKKPIE
jgi:hypothetical protein